MNWAVEQRVNIMVARHMKGTWLVQNHIEKKIRKICPFQWNMPTATLVSCCEFLAVGTVITVESHLKRVLHFKHGRKTQNRV